MMAFPRKHLLLVTSLVIGFICIGLYLFLVRPVMVKRQKTVRDIEEMTTELERYKDSPYYSPQGVIAISREKELLEKQYEDVVMKLNFSLRKSLPKEIGLLHLYFEEQLERAEDDLDRLGREKGIWIPDRLGFEKKEPQSREELAILLSQVAAAQELVTIAIEAGVNQISTINPLPPAGERPLPEGTEDRSMEEVTERPLFEELDIELSLRADLSTLTKLLYQLSTGDHFFTVEELELRSASAERGTTSYEAEPRRLGRRAMRREEEWMYKGVERVGEIALREERVTTEGKKKAIEEELEARILVCAQLLPEEKQ